MTRTALIAAGIVLASLTSQAAAQDADAPDAAEQSAVPILSSSTTERDIVGLYGFAYGGTNFDTTLDGDGDFSSLDLDFDNGFTFGFGIGSQFTPNWRAEVEFLYSRQDADALSFSGGGPASGVDGDLTTTAVFANGYYDFANDSPFTPYLGGGIGVARVDQDIFTAGGASLDESDTGFAAQAIAGVSYAVSDRVSLTADVRYRRIFDINTTSVMAAGGGTGSFSGDLETIAVNVGFRIMF